MSLEKSITGEPNRYLRGEGRKGKAEKQSELSQRSGGVSAGGIYGKDDGVRQETCGRGPEGPTAGTSRVSGKAGLSVAGVGDLHSSVDARESITREERRAGTCSNAYRRSDGKVIDEGETLWIGTPVKKNPKASNGAVSESKS